LSDGTLELFLPNRVASQFAYIQKRTSSVQLINAIGRGASEAAGKKYE
jgi:hypothetical protein